MAVESTPAEGQSRVNLTAYVKMSDTNVATELKSASNSIDPLSTTYAASGPIDSKLFKFTGESLRLTCANLRQKIALLKINEIGEHPVQITELQSVERQRLKTDNAMSDVVPCTTRAIGTVFGLPVDFSEAPIAADCGCDWIKPLS
jgi:hypothetical protein